MPFYKAGLMPVGLKLNKRASKREYSYIEAINLAVGFAFIRLQWLHAQSKCITQSKCKYSYIEAINLAVGFDMRPLPVTYTLSLTVIPFPGSFALLKDLKLALALALFGLLGVACIELAQLTLCYHV